MQITNFTESVPGYKKMDFPKTGSSDQFNNQAQSTEGTAIAQQLIPQKKKESLGMKFLHMCLQPFGTEKHYKAVAL